MNDICTCCNYPTTDGLCENPACVQDKSEAHRILIEAVLAQQEKEAARIAEAVRAFRRFYVQRTGKDV